MTKDDWDSYLHAWLFVGPPWDENNHDAVPHEDDREHGGEAGGA